MKLRFTVLTAVLLAASVSLAAPEMRPDRVVVNLTASPATSFAVSWRTAPEVKQATGEIAVAEKGPHFAGKASKVPAVSRSFEGDAESAAIYHSVTFDGLQPGTRYAYRVGDGQHWSEWNHVMTASLEAEPFSFLYFGDAQNDIYSHCSRVIRQGLLHCSDADFTLHAGDLVNTFNSDREWGEWFDAAGWIHRTIPVIAVPGNHEYGKPGLSPHWRHVFTMPENGPEELKESVYSLDYQGVRFVALNSNEKRSAQAVWLREVLRDNPNRWTIVTMHHPVYSTARGRDNAGMRDEWQPIFDEFGVDLVLQGHDHTYGRTGFMQYDPEVKEGHQATVSDSGVVYVVSVTGPKQYDLNRNDFMMKMAEQTQLYQIISIQGGELRYDAYNALGEKEDGFTLKKDKDGKKELVED